MGGFVLLLFQNPSDREIGKAWKSVFSNPDFPWSRAVHERNSDNLFLTLILKFLDFLQELQIKMMRLHHHSPVLFWILFVLLLVILVLLLVHIGRTLAMGFRFAFAKEGGQDLEERAQRKMRSSELRARARELAQRGSGAESIHYLLLSLLAFLEEKHILQVAKGWTNRELFRRLEAKLPIEDAWEPLEIQVEQVSYAGQPLSFENFEQMEKALDALLGLESQRT